MARISHEQVIAAGTYRTARKSLVVTTTRTTRIITPIHASTLAHMDVSRYELVSLHLRRHQRRFRSGQEEWHFFFRYAVEVDSCRDRIQYVGILSIVADHKGDKRISCFESHGRDARSGGGCLNVHVWATPYTTVLPSIIKGRISSLPTGDNGLWACYHECMCSTTFQIQPTQMIDDPWVAATSIAAQSY